MPTAQQPFSIRILLRWVCFSRRSLRSFHLLVLLQSFEIGLLKTVMELAELQSEHMDKMLLEEMYKMHMDRRKLATLPPGQQQSSADNPHLPLLQHILVVGGGPNGLYTLFRLFLDGHDVTLVEKRVRRDRSHFIMAEKIWAIQARLLILGSIYDRRFVADLLNYNDGLLGEGSRYVLCARVDDLEEALKERALQLANYLTTRNNPSGSTRDATPLPRFDLVYDAEFIGVEAPHSQPHRLEAVLRVSDTHQTRIEVNGKKMAFAHSKWERIPTDVVVCASGKGDKQCRQRYLGE